jgi:hypothetical protein
MGLFWTLACGPTVEVDSVRWRGGPELDIESRPVDMDALVESNAKPEYDDSRAGGMNALDMDCCTGGGAGTATGVLAEGKGRML